MPVWSLELGRLVCNLRIKDICKVQRDDTFCGQLGCVDACDRLVNVGLDVYVSR